MTIIVLLNISISKTVIPSFYALQSVDRLMQVGLLKMKADFLSRIDYNESLIKEKKYNSPEKSSNP